jgi:hypothetical protein
MRRRSAASGLWISSRSAGIPSGARVPGIAAAECEWDFLPSSRHQGLAGYCAERANVLESPGFAQAGRRLLVEDPTMQRIPRGWSSRDRCSRLGYRVIPWSSAEAAAGGTSGQSVPSGEVPEIWKTVTKAQTATPVRIWKRPSIDTDSFFC